MVTAALTEGLSKHGGPRVRSGSLLSQRRGADGKGGFPDYRALCLGTLKVASKVQGGGFM